MAGNEIVEPRPTMDWIAERRSRCLSERLLESVPTKEHGHAIRIANVDEGLAFVNLDGPEAAAEIERLQAEVERLMAWALDKASTHHRLAHENPNLRSEHIASSSAYRSLAEEIARAALTATDEKAPQ